eukprot:4283202-Prymnesium_polylepis.2
MHVPHTADDAAIAAAAGSELPRLALANVAVALDKVGVLGRPRTHATATVGGLPRMSVVVAPDVIKPRGECRLRRPGVNDFALRAILKVAVLVNVQVDVKPFYRGVAAVHWQVEGLPAAFRGADGAQVLVHFELVLGILALLFA